MNRFIDIVANQLLADTGDNQAFAAQVAKLFIHASLLSIGLFIVVMLFVLGLSVEIHRLKRDIRKLINVP